MIDRPLISEEEERLVVLQEVGNCQRSADRAAKLVPLERVPATGAEVIRGIEVAVTDKFKQVAVILVGSALGDDIDYAARVLAVLGVVVVGFDAELLHRIGHGERHVDVGVFVQVVAPSSM